jgi:hypothetical protein
LVPVSFCLVYSKPLYVIEIKCPIPGKSFTTPVPYEVPSYYIPQVLSEMKALNVMKTLYISFVSLNFDIASRRTLTVADVF